MKCNVMQTENPKPNRMQMQEMQMEEILAKTNVGLSCKFRFARDALRVKGKFPLDFQKKKTQAAPLP